MRSSLYLLDVNILLEKHYKLLYIMGVNKNHMMPLIYSASLVCSVTKIIYCVVGQQLTESNIFYVALAFAHE